MAVTTIDDRIATTDALMSSHIRYRGFQATSSADEDDQCRPQNLRTPCGTGIRAVAEAGRIAND